MKLDPDNAHLVLAHVPALISLARVLTEEQRVDEALTMIDRAAARVGQGAHPAAMLAATRGDILARMGQSQEAEAAFREEMQRFPQTTDAYVKLALLLASEHRFGEINPTLEAMVKASPRPATYFLAAKELSDLGNAVEAASFRSRGEKLARQIQEQ